MLFPLPQQYHSFFLSLHDSDKLITSPAHLQSPGCTPPSGLTLQEQPEVVMMVLGGLGRAQTAALISGPRPQMR